MFRIEVVPVLGLLAFLASLILLGLAAARYGVDSRDGNDWADHPRV